MRMAELSVFNNKWFQIFDFSAGESDEENWTLVRGDVSLYLRFSIQMIHTCIIFMENYTECCIFSGKTILRFDVFTGTP